MAAVHPVESLQEEASCSICLDYFTDPVITDCGHNFCRSCITQFWEGRDTASPCPQCRRMSRMSTLRPNRQLANMTEMVKKLGQTPKRPNQESRCEKHEESLTLFCKEDQRALCLQCTKSQDHRFHRVIPVEEAEQEYKENLKRCLNPLRKDLEDLLKFKSAEEKKAEELKSETQIQRQTVESVFEELHQTLNKKKQVLLSRLEEEEKKILERIRENVTQVEEQSSSLMQLISEIEEKGQQLVAKSVKDVRDAFIRYHKMKLPGPEAVSIDLKIGFSLSYPQQLKEVIAKFGDWWMECGRIAVDVTLDLETAHHDLILSEDRKSVRCGQPRQNLPSNPERFDVYVCVLGSEGFISGQCYWEVEMGDMTNCMLGVCEDSAGRKGPIRMSPAEGYWIVMVSDEYGNWVFVSPNFRGRLSERPQAMGILLDYEAGKVLFYNADNKSLLHTFTTTFRGKVRPFFYNCSKMPLRIRPVPVWELNGGALSLFNNLYLGR